MEYQAKMGLKALLSTMKYLMRAVKAFAVSF